MIINFIDTKHFICKVQFNFEWIILSVIWTIGIFSINYYTSYLIHSPEKSYGKHWNNFWEYLKVYELNRSFTKSFQFLWNVVWFYRLSQGNVLLSTLFHFTFEKVIRGMGAKWFTYSSQRIKCHFFTYVLVQYFCLYILIRNFFRPEKKLVSKKKKWAFLGHWAGPYPIYAWTPEKYNTQMILYRRNNKLSILCDITKKRLYYYNTNTRS